jgi:hypothetical protein
MRALRKSIVSWVFRYAVVFSVLAWSWTSRLNAQCFTGGCEQFGCPYICHCFSYDGWWEYCGAPFAANCDSGWVFLLIKEVDGYTNPPGGGGI